MIDKYENQINEEEFESILMDNTLSILDKIDLVNFLYDELKLMGKSLYSYFPNLDRELNAISNHLQQPGAGAAYWGERLWWLTEAEGYHHRAALYLHYYQHDSYYKVVKLDDERYAWYGSGDDWYICRADRWNINRFYKAMDAALAEEN